MVQVDVEAAAVGVESWLGPVRASVTAIAAGDQCLVQDTVALAAVLWESAALSSRRLSRPCRVAPSSAVKIEKPFPA